MRLSFIKKCPYALVVVVSFALLVSCSDDSGDGGINDPGLPGPCIHSFLSPVLEVSSASVVGSGVIIDTLYISSVSLEGREYPLDELLSVTASGVELVDGILVGQIPFGFGVIEGRYSLNITAAGMLGTTVEVDAAYSEFVGGCPSFNDGATEVTIRLTEE